MLNNKNYEDLNFWINLTFYFKINFYFIVSKTIKSIFQENVFLKSDWIVIFIEKVIKENQILYTVFQNAIILHIFDQLI